MQYFSTGKGIAYFCVLKTRRIVTKKMAVQVMLMILIGADSRDAFGRCGGIKPEGKGCLSINFDLQY
jgi:hypothetical protein